MTFRQAATGLAVTPAIGQRNSRRTSKTWFGAWRAVLPFAALAMLVLLGDQLTGAAFAQANPPEPVATHKNILVLCSYGYGGRGVEVFNDGLIQVLTAAGTNINDVYFEYLDLERNQADAQYRARLQDFLLKKYATRNIDVIATVQQPALGFLLDEGKSLAPQAPVITMQAPVPSAAQTGGRHILSEVANFDVQGTLELAFKIFPQTRRIVIASGNSPSDTTMAAAATTYANRWRGQVEFEYTFGLPLHRMLERMHNLPPHTIILFTQYNRDINNHVYASYEVEGKVVQTANAPVFGLYDFNLRNGGIGGSVVSVSGLGEATARLTQALWEHKLNHRDPITTLSNDVLPMFDWEQIKYWGGDVSQLPPQTVFTHRLPGFWQQYGIIVVAVMLISVAQFLLITSLLLNKQRRKLAEQKTAESEARYRVLVESAPDAIAVYDIDQRSFIDCNAAAETLFGCNREFLLAGGPERFYQPEQFGGRSAVEVILESTDRALHGEQVVVERAVCNARGEKLHVEMRLVHLPATDRRLIRASMVDVTERRKAQEELRIAATAFESQEGMFVTDAERTILRVNRLFTEITGYSAAEAVGQNPRLLKSGQHDQAFYAAMNESLEKTGSWQGEIWNHRKNGEAFPEWLAISSVKDEAGTVTNYVGTFSDISLRKSREEEIRNLAYYDPLTHLPNRRLLHDRLEQALVSSARHHCHGALLFIDLDNFKILNDSLGHDIGDLLLQQVAQRLTENVRASDTVARLGGDEFVIILENLATNAREAALQARQISEKILTTLQRTYLLVTHEYHSTSSIGVTLFSNRMETIQDLLKQADLAMYQAKAAGRNTQCFFDPEMQASVSARATLDAGLREAVLKQQFILYYQAQVAGAAGGSQHLLGAEVLLRWQHPQRGIVSPADFITLAEETGLILPLGQWVMQTACAQLARWASQPSMQHLCIAVNVSALQFRQPDFVTQVLDTLAQHGANPQRLKLELTESVLVTDVENIIAKMTHLKEKGVGFSLDDFGTGYSSLSYLKRLPLDQLKIDQNFVRDILIDPNDAAIARMIIALAASLGLMVIAEGVETQAQRDFLEREGCCAYQGYLYSKPVPLAQFEALASGFSHNASEC